ncbi:MAG: redoxin domain-containing protein [Thermoplasmata archaeon]
MRRRAVIILVVVLAALLVPAAYAVQLFVLEPSHGSSAQRAPDFTLEDIHGRNITLSNYQNTSVVVIEFTSLSCTECQVVEQSLKSLYGTYNQSGQTNVQILSIYVEPQYGDTIPALKAYQAKNGISWEMAQDTDSLSVYRAYGVVDIPTVVVIDKKGFVDYDVNGVQNDGTLRSAINSALSGTGTPISLVSVSVFALAAVAGVSTFFSPCAFPMFPGYMGLFLGLNATPTETSATGTGTYVGSVRRAAVAGTVTAIGMILVFLIIGVALIYAASLVSGYIPDLLIVVGSALIVLGALLLTNLQYWRIVTPFQMLWHRIRGKDASGVQAAAVVATSGQGYHVKLFSYGMGYAAAAAGCVAPVIFSAIIAGLALGLWGGIANVLIFALTAAGLMIAVTVLLAVAGKRFVNQLKAYTPLIKKVSAVALLVVGVYLVYFYYTAWIV